MLRQKQAYSFHTHQLANIAALLTGNPSKLRGFSRGIAAFTSVGTRSSPKFARSSQESQKRLDCSARPHSPDNGPGWQVRSSGPPLGRFRGSCGSTIPTAFSGNPARVVAFLRQRPGVAFNDHRQLHLDRLADAPRPGLPIKKSARCMYRFTLAVKPSTKRGKRDFCAPQRGGQFLVSPAYEDQLQFQIRSGRAPRLYPASPSIRSPPNKTSAVGRSGRSPRPGFRPSTARSSTGGS
jgi:hypothetical protein